MRKSAWYYRNARWLILLRRIADRPGQRPSPHSPNDRAANRKLTRPGGWFDTLQTTTGAYLLMFLLSHVSAVGRARMLRHVDTGWAWLDGGELLTDPWSARLVPYYFAAVIALGMHAGCGLRTVLLGHGVGATRGSAIVAVVAGLAGLVATLILIGLLRA